jgi:predicted transcriptional regulator
MVQRHLSSVARYSFLVVGMTALTGCGLINGDYRESNADQRSLFAALSFKNIFGLHDADDLNAIETASGPLTVYDAVAMALHKNLNERSTTQNEAATGALALLDSGIRAARQNRDEDVSLTLRQHDAAQTILRDVRLAYARTAIADSLQNEISDALAKTATPETATNETDMTAHAALEKMHNDLGAARLELASLLGVSDPESLVLDPAQRGQNSLSPITVTLNDLEILGLTQRLETRNGHESAETLRQNAMNSFPGIGDILTQNKNGMGPKDEAEWAAFLNPFGRGLVKIFANDLDVKNPQNIERLDHLRQNAISAAILSQIHIAHTRYQGAQSRLASLQAKDEPQDTLQNLIHRARLALARTETQNHYDDVLTALGIHILPDQMTSMPTEKLAAALQARIDGLTPVALAQMVTPQSMLAMNVAAGLPLEQARFTDGMPERIPFAQKISVQRDIEIASTPSRFLSISKRQLQSLLNAPISEP